MHGDAFFVVENTIPNLGKESVTPSLNDSHPVHMSQRVSKAPKMPQLEPTLPTPAPTHKDLQLVQKSKIPKPRQTSFVSIKLDPSKIGSLSPSHVEPEIFTKSYHSFTSARTTPRMSQNPFIPFSNDRDDVHSKSAAPRGLSAVDKAGERQLKAVIPSPFDPAQEQPSFQDIHDKSNIGKKKKIFFVY